MMKARCLIAGTNIQAQIVPDGILARHSGKRQSASWGHRPRATETADCIYQNVVPPQNRPIGIWKSIGGIAEADGANRRTTAPQ